MNRPEPSANREARAPAPYGIAPPGYRLPEAIRLGRVKLQVANLERSLAYYRRVIGLETQDGTGSRALLGCGSDPEPLLELHEHPGAAPARPHSRLGLYHFALRVPDRAALGRFARHVAALDERVGMADHLVSEALYLSDPDGLGIEVYADRPRGQWEHRGRQLVMGTEPLDVVDLVSHAGDDPFIGMPPDTVVGHVHLHVGDLGQASRFYHAGLGFDKVVWGYPGAMFLSAGGYHHHLGVNTWASRAPAAGPDDARLLAWTIVLPGSGEADGAAESLRSAGDRVDRVAGHWRAEDPWGTAVELLCASDARRSMRARSSSARTGR